MVVLCYDSFMNTCIFCRIATGEIPAHTVWENKQFVAFLDLKPNNPGHLLVVPREHIPYVFDLGEPLYSETFQVAKQLAGPLQLVTQAKRIGLVVEGFGVDHTHLHLIPINQGGELDSHYAQEAKSEDLEQMAARLREEIAR